MPWVFWWGVQHFFNMTRHRVIILYRFPPKHHHAIMRLPLGGFSPSGFSYTVLTYTVKKSEHNYIHPELLTTVQSNDGTENNKRHNSEARLFWHFKPRVIMKIGALQYISALQQMLRLLSLHVQYYMYVYTTTNPVRKLHSRPCTGYYAVPVSGPPLTLIGLFMSLFLSHLDHSPLSTLTPRLFPD